MSYGFITTEQAHSSIKPLPRTVASWYIATVRHHTRPTRSLHLDPLPGGISLSPAFVVMYVMQNLQIPWEDALHLVQNRRYCISPNGGFLTQIKVRHGDNWHPCPYTISTYRNTSLSTRRLSRFGISHNRVMVTRGVNARMIVTKRMKLGIVSPASTYVCHIETHYSPQGRRP